MTKTSLGIRVKSGWASAILLTLRRQAPQFLLRRRLLLADPKVPQSSQPYHHGFGRLEKNPVILGRLTRIVSATTTRSLSALIAECHKLGYMPGAVALVVGSTVDPGHITSEHIRAHALEAQLFRTALAQAAARLELEVIVIRERDLPALVRKVLGQHAAAEVAELRQVAGPPWRADEKLATLAAWTVAARGRPASGRAATA